jgi:hypothetical protein
LFWSCGSKLNLIVKQVAVIANVSHLTMNDYMIVVLLPKVPEESP